MYKVYKKKLAEAALNIVRVANSINDDFAEDMVFDRDAKKNVQIVQRLITVVEELYNIMQGKDKES